MNQKKNIKGFTLIELLAVIVILAIIALIAVPTIMNIISKANESAFKDSAYGVISAGELYFAEMQLEPNGMLEDVTFNLPDERLQMKGEVPKGSIIITKEGDIAIAVYNNRYCITKGFSDKDVTITEDYENCKIIMPGSIASLATTSTEVPTKPECLNDGTTCTPGTPVAIKVNASDVYNFYVIDETDNEVTLIMDRNIGDNIAWASEEDYGCGVAGDYCALNDKGPITAVKTLKARTSSWTNIPEREYIYSDGVAATRYQSFTETMRARMLTHTEANSIMVANNDAMPFWLNVNLYVSGDENTYGYWLSSVDADESNSFNAYVVYCHGWLATQTISSNTSYGLRPVIVLSK